MKKFHGRTTVTRWSLAVALMFVGADTGFADLSISFEAEEGYFTACPIEQTTGWRSIPEGIGMVTQESSFNGGQSLKIEPNRSYQLGGLGWKLTYQSDGLPQTGVRFVEFGIKLESATGRQISEYRNGKTFMDLWGASIAFESDENGNLRLVAGGTAENNVDPILIQAIEGVESNRWLYLVIRQDLDAGTWEFYVDGVLEVIDVTLLPGEDRNRLAVFSKKTEATYIDGICISTENPFFLDEVQYDFTDTRGVSDQASFKRTDRMMGRNQGKEEARKVESPPSETLMDLNSQTPESTSQTLYVDNAVGDNGNSGMFPHAFGRNGPKASIKAAMVAAQNGSVIIVLPGKGIYEEGSRSAHGKKLTIRTVKPIIIK